MRVALRHKRNQGHRVGNIPFGSRLAADGQHLEPDAAKQTGLQEIRPDAERGHESTRDRRCFKRARVSRAPRDGLAAGMRER